MPDSVITKRALAAKMKEMMAQTSFLKINVSDICRECQISRKCFYYHFKDKYDLVNWIFQDDFLNTFAKREYESSWDLFEDVCVFFYDRRKFYLNALQATGPNSFHDYCCQLLEDILFKYLELVLPDEEQQRVFAEFFADAYMVSIEKWLTHYSQMKPHDYVKLMRLPLEDSKRIG